MSEIFTFLTMSLLCPYLSLLCPYFCKYVYRLLGTVGRVVKVYCGLHSTPNYNRQQSPTTNKKVMSMIFTFLVMSLLLSLLCPYFWRCPYFCPYLSLLCPYFCKYVFQLLGTVGRVVKVYCGLHSTPNYIPQQSPTTDKKVMSMIFTFLAMSLLLSLLCPYFVLTLSLLVLTLSLLWICQSGKISNGPISNSGRAWMLNILF
jgi:hypothetical protein